MRTATTTIGETHRVDSVVVALVVVVCSQQGRARGDSVSGHFPTRFFFRLI